MAKFDLAILLILKHEGKLADNPNDPGGITNYGISLRWLKAKGIDVDGDGDVDGDDIRALNAFAATELYRKFIWHFDDVQDQTLAMKIFDIEVNMGPRGATIITQRALNRMKFGVYVKEDGRWGPKTLRAVNRARPVEILLRNIRAHQLIRYFKIVRKNPDLEEFLYAWCRRALA